jgi:hypothetical protein
MDNNSAESVHLLEVARAGDASALEEIFTRYRGRLRRMVDQIDARRRAADRRSGGASST